MKKFKVGDLVVYSGGQIATSTCWYRDGGTCVVVDVEPHFRDAITLGRGSKIFKNLSPAYFKLYEPSWEND